ncbi:MAG TPA: hypothetical protein VK750_10715 [Cytophagaceae bacterium]|jgi:hypothetical protein|nr:hypothetical protein [Cytophagaceae bacterium]
MTTSLTDIKNHTELRFKLMQLKNLRAEQELELKRGIKELYQSMHPVNLLRSTISEIASDKQVQYDATKIGLNMGSEFLIGKLMGSNTSIKKYIGSLILQKATDYFIANHPEKIVWGAEKLNALFRSFTKKKKVENGMTHE